MPQPQLNERTNRLKQVLDDVLNLRLSPLYAYRCENHYLPVVGEGSPEARVMFVGEAPGKNEAVSGRPFAGAAGKILDELLASIALPRAEVYITNIVKDRPPSNRDPLPAEISLYAPFLDRQIEIIQPAVIATLGRHPMKYVLERYGAGISGTIGELHGRACPVRMSYGPAQVLPLYHPAAAIYNRTLMDDLKLDFKRLKRYAA